MLSQIARLGRNHSPNLADLQRDETGVGKMSDSQRNIDPFVDQIDRPIQKVQPSRYGWRLIHKFIDHWPKYGFSRRDRCRQVQQA